MRKGVVFIAVAALTFAVGDFCFGLLVRGVLQRTDFRFARLYTGRLQADVIVLGNSRAVNGFCAPKVTSLTGLRWVNLGYNGMGPELVEAIALDYLDRYPAPRAVVLEVSNVMQANASLRDCRLFTSESARLAKLDRKESGLYGTLAAHVHALAANGEMLLRCAYYLRHRDQEWVNEGQLDVGQAERLRDEASARIAGAALEESVAAARRLVAELRRRNIEVWCVVSPYLLNAEGQVLAASWLGSVAGPDAGGVRLVSWVSAVSDPRLYADPSHLNRSGSTAFAERVAQDFLAAKDRP